MGLDRLELEGCRAPRGRVPDPDHWEDPKSRTPFWIRLRLWCRLQSLNVDLFFGSVGVWGGGLDLQGGAWLEIVVGLFG